MEFTVTTTHEVQRSKVMEIARARSITYSHAFGAGDYCETEMHGTIHDYNEIKNAVNSGEIIAEIDTFEL